MNKIAMILAVVLLVSVVQGCQRKVPDLKSPCVGAPGSPCDKRPVPGNQSYV